MKRFLLFFFFLCLIKISGRTVPSQSTPNRISDSSSIRLGSNPILTIGLSFIPGLGQFYSGHPVKGISFVSATSIAWLVAYYNYQQRALSALRLYREKAEERSFLKGEITQKAVAFQQGIPSSQDSLLMSSLVEQYNQVTLDARARYGFFLERNVESNLTWFWLGGIYVYNLFDAWHQAFLKAPEFSRKKKNPKKAMFLSLLIPGAGQCYNQEYSKCGMIIMGQIGLIGNAVMRNTAARYYQEIGKESLAEFNTRKRNTHLWYLAGFYFYNIFDAFVDAYLWDFDTGHSIQLELRDHFFSLQLKCPFRF